MPIYKRCGKCGARLPAGQTCPNCKRKYEPKTKDIYTKFYASGDWQKARQLCISRLNGLDWYEYITTGRLIPGDTVHHIIPVKEDFSLRLDKRNLIYLSNSNHQQVHIELDAGGKRKEKVIQDLRRALAIGMAGGKGEP